MTANTIEAKVNSTQASLLPECTTDVCFIQMLERAGNKRKLEALVIGSGKYTASLEDLQDIFKGGKSGSSNDKAAGFAAQMVADEMRGQGQRENDEEAADKEIRVIKDGEEVISDKQLALLLDRSDDAMKRGKGWKAEQKVVGKTAPKAFEVIETVAANGADEEDVSFLTAVYIYPGLHADDTPYRCHRTLTRFSNTTAVQGRRRPKLVKKSRQPNDGSVIDRWQ